MNFERSSGILLHITSLPNKFGIGSLGREAFDFIDFLKESGQSLWQILPMGPTGYGDSPYQCFSAFAGNALLIDIDNLIERKLLNRDDVAIIPEFSNDIVEYDRVREYKNKLFETAFLNFTEFADLEEQAEFEAFCIKNSEWLDDFSLFMSLKEHFNLKPWYEWNEAIKIRKSKDLNKLKIELEERIEFYKYLQFLFFVQWSDLKKYANESGVRIIGDIPLYVSLDSVEAWANPELFLFDEDRNPTFVAGVPPDYFSETGQLWGNPIYDWKKHKRTNFRWWINRVKANLEMYDIIRIDHFRGLVAYWSIPFGEETAINGTWVDAPGKELFTALKNEMGDLPIIAEDLGVITDDVVELREKFALPGMKILQFAFDASEENNYLPHTYDKNCVVYTGTHDNDTTLGWHLSTNDINRNFAREYLGICEFEHEIVWKFIIEAWKSVANIAIVPMQDILNLDSECRTNIPGTSSGNWKWRYNETISSEIIEKLKKLSHIYGRI
ncbi:MAG TPA: 4-alpha-glucanotransferase [Bacteroidales bacterium]|nr:MAG: 4-alpha-glucanotransferase [Bacteroidetes bacterium GWF2_33_38]OFY72169.1 MAG: 4-alpha-glucanotransferase [Bacteroidetes bacterium RIFOXYA12_FULL_33_9]OFY86000.1 MAG: 4-alpha-glucanotransferase [Bacteroidetes bacterium RIFOXYA2_FULL_33_7]HBF88935.1 4-alpha-glucanotransferase [Bacteroidales bacterium]